MADLYSWLLSFFILLTSLGIVFFQLMSLKDLEVDYINPYDSASRINKVVLAEFISQGSLCLIHLMAGHWPMFLLCFPIAYYNVRLFTRGQHLVDVTEIFNQLPWENNQRKYKLVYLIFLLAFSIFWMIWSTLDDEESFV